jgi:hypothetical protein
MAADIERLADGTYVRHSDAPSDSKSDDRFWATAEEPAQALWSLVRSLRNRQNWRRQADELALKLYSDMRYVGYRTRSGSFALSDVLDSRMGENVIRAIVRALNSKIARRRSRPYVVTDGAKWHQRQTAENLEKWLLGKMRQHRADEEIFPLWRLHGLVFGTGVIRTYGTPEKGACMEVIPSNEIVVDDAEAKYGKPPNIYFIRTASMAKLRHDYPEKRAILDQTPCGSSAMDDGWVSDVGAWDHERNSDICYIIEAYHLPSGEGAGDGRHVICTSAGILHDEKWKRDHFPLAIIRGELRPMGMWGIGVPEDLAPTQIEITENAMARKEIIDTLARPYWLVERGMKVARAAISNVIGRVMEWTSTGSGLKPELVAAPVVPPDIWQHGIQLKQAAFETKGVSQLTAQMLKPQGLNSGKALRAFHEMESELLADLMYDYENGLLRLCELLVEEQIELGDAYKDQAVTYVGEGEIEEIKWSDVGLQKDLQGYVIEILPASAMASTLSARIEDVYDMKDLGLLVEPDEIWDYLQMPDRRRVQRKHGAPRKLLEKVVEFRIIKRGEDVMPEPTWDLDLAIDLALTSIKELELYEDAPEDRLELLRQFILKCQALKDFGSAPQEQMINDVSGDPSGLAPIQPPGPDAALAGGGVPPGAGPIAEPGVPGIGPAAAAGPAV